MDIQIHYCKHCGSRYTYQASGEGCFAPTNDPEYCPECKRRIIEALKDVKPTTKLVYKEIDNHANPLYVYADLPCAVHFKELLKKHENNKVIALMSFTEYNGFDKGMLSQNEYVRYSFGFNGGKYVVVCAVDSNRIRIFKAWDVCCENGSLISSHPFIFANHRVSDDLLYEHSKPMHLLVEDMKKYFDKNPKKDWSEVSKKLGDLEYFEVV